MINTLPLVIALRRIRKMENVNVTHKSPIHIIVQCQNYENIICNKFNNCIRDNLLHQSEVHASQHNCL